MTRRFDTRIFAAAFPAAALFAAALACQAEPAPSVQSEPARPPPAASAPAASSPAAGSLEGAPRTAAGAEPSSSSQVGLAKYEEPNGARSSSAASAGAAASPEAPSAAADAPAKGTKGAGHTVQGAVVTEEPFSVWLQADSPLAAGSPGTVEAVLVAKPPYHCNAEYPHKFKLGAAPAGLSYPESTVKGAKVTPERSVLAIPVQAGSPGKATVSGTLQFSVCNDERCLVEKRELALALEVK